MKPLNNEELDHLHSLLADENSRHCNHPEGFDEESINLNSDLLERFTDEAKRRGIWWTR